MLKRILLVSVSLAMASYLPSESFAGFSSVSSSRSISVSPSRSVSSPVRSYTAVKATPTATKTVTRSSAVRRPVNANRPVANQPQQSSATSRSRSHYEYYDFNECKPYQSVTSGKGWKCLDND
jgi:hypothetical protein